MSRAFGLTVPTALAVGVDPLLLFSVETHGLRAVKLGSLELRASKTALPRDMMAIALRGDVMAIAIPRDIMAETANQRPERCESISDTNRQDLRPDTRTCQRQTSINVLVFRIGWVGGMKAATTPFKATTPPDVPRPLNSGLDEDSGTGP